MEKKEGRQTDMEITLGRQVGMYGEREKKKYG